MLGRLNAEEFSERLDKALEAKTIGDLDNLLSDLPAIDLYRLPDAKLSRQPRQALLPPVPRRRRSSPVWRSAWGSWFTVTVVCFVVWALSDGGYPWPLWVVGPWGAVLACRWLTDGGIRSARHQLGPGPGQGQLPGSQDARDEPPRP